MPAHRYARVAGNRWPMTVVPAPGELLSSWLHRLAHANGVPPRYFGGLLGAQGGNWSARLDRGLPDYVLQLLHDRTQVPLDDIAGLTVTPDPLIRLRLPLHSTRRKSNALAFQTAWLQFCPACLNEDEAPYFRRGWSLATRLSCFHHGCRLRDRCPSCGNGLAPFRQGQLVPQQFCAFCGSHLGKRTSHSSPGVRRLERLIDDLLRLYSAGHQWPGRGSLPDLLAAAHFPARAGTEPITQLSHRDRYGLFRRLTEEAFPLTEGRASSAVRCWTRIAQAALDHRGLVTMLTETLVTRKRPERGTSVATPGLIDLVQAAAHLQAKRLTRLHALTAS